MKYSGRPYRPKDCAAHKSDDLLSEEESTQRFHTARKEDLLPLDDLDPEEQLQEFCDMLYDMATGAYVSDASDYWEPPFDEEAVTALEEIIGKFLKRIRIPGIDPLLETQATVGELDELNEEFDGMLIDVEEEAEIITIFQTAWRQAGYDDFQEFPEFESFEEYLDY